MRSFRIIWWCAGLMAAGVAAAQETLTLDQALEEAARQNPDLRAAYASWEKARATWRASYSAFLPQLAARASDSRHGSDSGEDGSSSTSDSKSLGVSAQQTLFAGGRNRAATEQARADLARVEAGLRQAESELTYNVRRAFAQLLYAQDQVELARSIAARRKDNADLIQLRYEGGREHQGSLLRMQAAYADAEWEVTKARRARVEAERQLARVLGRGGAPELKARGAWEVAAPPDRADFAALAEQTPEWQLSEAELRSARAGVRSARGDFLPEVSANASAGRFGEDWMPRQDEWSVGWSLSWSFFPGGRNFMNLRAARAELRRAEASARSRNDQVRLELEQACIAFQDAAGQIPILSLYLEAAEVRATVARSQYTSGLMSFENWDPIENDLIGQQRSLLSGRLDAVLAEAQWEKIQGRSRLPGTAAGGEAR